MSAINDALRRASGAATAGSEPPPLPSSEGPLTAGDLPPLLVNHSISVPLDGENPLLQPPPAKKGFPWIIVIIVLLFGAGGAAGFFLWQRHQAQTVARLASRKLDPTPRPTIAKPAVTPEKQPEKTNAVQRPDAPVVAAVAPSAPAPAPAAAPVVAASPPRNVQFPQLRLQGIYYRPSSPSVMINNRTLYCGDQVQGVTVAAIDASSVTLVLSGQTNVLTLR